MLRVDPDRRLVRHVFAEKTSKEIRMKDVHNIASRMRTPVTTSTNAVQNLCEWAEAKYPSLYMELAVDPEDSTVCGIFMQDPQMVSAFDRFPEVILMDATHKTNQQDMPLYTLLCIDGNGESQVAAAFLVQKEDEGTIRKMLQIFKERNPKYLETVVVMTDKDMTERNVIKSEMPHISLQICLFHVLRTFGREITPDKMGISSGEKSTVLAHIQELTYSRDEEDYIRRYDQLCLAMSTRVRRYFDDNWHHIREEWVEGLKCKQMNLGVRTNNRVESFFSHLKKSLVQRGRLQDLIERYMLCLSTLRSERSHRLLQALSKVPCTPVSPEEEAYRRYVTPYCFNMIQEQLKASLKVEVLTSSSVMSSSGTREVTNTDCTCAFFTSMRIPCKHILAIRRFNEVDTFCADLVNIRWTAKYYSSKVHITAARPRLSISTQSTPRRGPAMSERDRFKKAGDQLLELQNTMAQCGTAEFKRRSKVVSELIQIWRDAKQVQLLIQEEVGTPEDTATPEEDTTLEETSTPEDTATPEEDTTLEETSTPEDTTTLEEDTTLEETSTPEDTTTPEEAITLEETARTSLPDVREIRFAPKCKKRGRPKGSCTTAIGLPKAKKVKKTRCSPFHTLDI